MSAAGTLAPRIVQIMQQGLRLDLDVAEEMIAQRGEIDVEVGDAVEREHEAELAQALQAGKLVRRQDREPRAGSPGR